MADNKKIFTIQINGIKESTDAIEVLYKQLEELEKKIKDLEKKQIKVSASTSTDSSNSGSSRGAKTQLSEQEKLQKQINKEIEKRAAMQTKEYQELLKQKKETKELADLQKLISKGDVINQDGLIKFNQTIGGIKAELRSLNLYIDTLKNPGEDWDGSFEGLEEELAAATERAGKLQERLKALEALKGVYGRNVGNYPGKDDTFPGGSEVIKYDTPKLKEYISTLKEKIKTEGSDLNLLKSLQTAMDALLKRTKTNTSEFKEYQSELSNINDELNKLSGKNMQGLRAEDVIDPKINIELKELKQNLQFDDVNQAIGVLEDKLYAMSKAGEQTSEAFKEIQETIIDLRRNVIDTDATIDAMVSRTRGLDLTVQSFQALTAAMQVGAGVAGLFGKNEEELQKTIAKVTSLMSIAQGVQELYNQVTKKGTALNKLWQLSLAGAQKVINLFSKTQKVSTASTVANTNAIAANAAATTATATAATTATTATKTFTIAMKGLKLAIASTGIGLLVVGLGEVVSWLTKATDSTEKYKKTNEAMRASINGINSVLKQQMGISEDLYSLNVISDLEKMIYNYYDLSNALESYNKQLGYYAKGLSDVKKQMTGMNDKSFGKFFKDLLTAGSVRTSRPDLLVSDDEAKKYRDNQLKLNYLIADYMIAQENAIKGEKNRGKSLKELNQQLALALKLQLSDLKEAFKFEEGDSFKDKMSKINSLLEHFNITISNIKNAGISLDDVFGEDEGIKSLIEGITEIKNEYNKSINEIINFGEKAKQAAYETNLETFNKMLSKRIEALNAQRHKELEIYRTMNSGSTIEENIKLLSKISAETAENVKKHVMAINKKYDTLIVKERREALLKQQQIELDIESNKLSVLKEGLNKELKIIENQRKKELLSAEQSDEMIGEQSKAINEKYDAEILKAKENFYRRREEAFKQFALNYKNISNSFAAADYEAQVQDVNIQSQEKQGSLTFDTDATLNDSIESQRKYNEEIVKLKMEAINRLNELDKNRTIDTMYGNRHSETDRYKERLKVIEDYYKQGLTSEAEYNQQLENEKQQHNDMLVQIETEGQRAIVDVDKKYNEERQKALANSNANVIRSYNDYFNEIEKLQSNSTSTNELTGIIDYKSTKQNLEKVKNEYSNLLKQINLEYDKLQKQFDNKEISFNDFQEAKKELKDLEQATKDAGKNVSQSMDELISVTIQSYTQMLGQGLQLIAEIWQTISDMRVAAIEAQISDLEDEYSELEKAYQKQEELVQKHTDKVSDIENELKTARGDRRAYLVEQLNSERRAQIEALQEEENIERKKQQNEKKQEALDKKRQREQKKAAKAQAIISGALTIANALATAPFIPVGIAMGALATGLVAVQIAKINSTQYADGGLLNGKSHSQGGIPVGNTGIEVEGNEYVVNKKSTQANLPLIDYINSNRRKLTREDLVNFFDNGKNGLINKSVKNRYAEGGVLPEVGEIDVKSLINYEPEQDNRPIQVQVVDIINASENVRQVQTMAGL